MTKLIMDLTKNKPLGPSLKRIEDRFLYDLVEIQRNKNTCCIPLVDEIIVPWIYHDEVVEDVVYLLKKRLRINVSKQRFY